MSEDMDKKAQARELLIRSKVYRMLAVMFLVVGIILIAVIYVKVSGGDAAKALQNPVIIIGIVVTFLPASVLSLLASKAEKKLAKIVESISK